MDGTVIVPRDFEFGKNREVFSKLEGEAMGRPSLDDPSLGRIGVGEDKN